MRVALIAVGSLGDVVPYVALGVGLQERGHDVLVVTHRRYESVARSRGLDTYGLEGDPGQILASDAGQAWIRSGRNPIRLAQRLMPVVEPYLMQYVADCWTACQGVQAIIVSWMGFYVASHVAERLAVPLVRAFLSPITRSESIPNAYVPTPTPLANRLNPLTHWLYDQVSWSFLRDSVNAARKEVLGLGPQQRTGQSGRGDDSGSLVLYGYSPSVLAKPKDWNERTHVTGYWFLDRMVDWKPDPKLVDFLSAGAPPVYVGFGSMVEPEKEQTLQLVLDALARARQRGVLVGDWCGYESCAPSDDAFCSSPIPHDWLFPQVSAAVHHGGAGTTGAALRAGIPMSIVAFFADQVFWGRLLHKLGAGTQLIPREQLTVHRLADAITSATHDRKLRMRAEALGYAIRAEHGVATAVSRFEAHLQAAGSMKAAS